MSSAIDFDPLYGAAKALSQKILDAIGKPSWQIDNVSLHQDGAFFFDAYRCLTEFEQTVRAALGIPRPR